jgi:dihydroorotate dehydrogenase
VIYRLLYTLVLRRVPPETAHALAARAIGAAGRIRLVRTALRRLSGAGDPRLRVDAMGLRFPSPLGVAAGVDKDASWFEGLGALGFGFVEVGTITPAAQEGNPRPRIARLTADRALQNSMGFPNAGAAVAAGRLSARTGATVAGVNVGKSRAAAAGEAGADYRESVRRLGALADYIVLNVSSPNTAGLRDLQAVAPLRGLVEAVQAELRELGVSRPVLVKIAPDLADEDVDAIADLALELGLAGLVATNTTVDRSGLVTDPAAVPPEGGISGAPLKARSLEVLRRLRARVGDRLVLISVGGVESADDVWERIGAGATLVQAYTGFVYGGPLWPRRVNRDLARRVRAAGAGSIGELVGVAAVAARQCPELDSNQRPTP